MTYYMGVVALIQNYAFEDLLIIAKIHVINVFITTIIGFILLIRRLMDMGNLKILWIYIIGIAIYGFFLKDSMIMFIRSMDSYQLLSTNTFAYYWGYVMLSFLFISVVPGDVGKNQYGEVPWIEKTDWGNIYFPMYPIGFKCKDFDSINKKDFIKRVIKNFSLNPKRINGQSKRLDLLLYYIGYQVIVYGFIAVVLIISNSIGKWNITLYQILFHGVYYAFIVWILITLFYLLVRRLHDSGRSALWLLGVLIPYLNIYVFYLIVFKPSCSPSLVTETDL